MEPALGGFRDRSAIGYEFFEFSHDVPCDFGSEHHHVIHCSDDLLAHLVGVDIGAQYISVLVSDGLLNLIDVHDRWEPRFRGSGTAVMRSR